MAHSINTQGAMDMRNVMLITHFGSCHNHVYLGSDARVLRVMVAACYTFTYKGFVESTNMECTASGQFIRFAGLS
ncbi:hypothetical protein BDV10DRAFT_179851 [Aspergillus recurvatus]